jgi:hypothetical protein
MQEDITPYVFQEFPKWVTVGENEPVLCEDKEAELALTGEAADKPKRGRPAKAD